MRAFAFLSHSDADKEFVQRLRASLGQENVWVDLWNLDAGDTLPQKIAEAIHLSKWFVLVASKSSMASRWVRYELNLALIRWIEEADCRIVAVRIDNCKLHPELSPFLRVDCPGKPEEAIRKVTEFIKSEQGRGVTPAKERRRRIVDRFNEIAAIERLIHENIQFIVLWGMYGIGKTSIVERASEEVFNMSLARFPLTQAHGALRLSLELAARANAAFPSATAEDKELTQSSVNSIIKLTQQGYVIFFDDLENALEEDGSLRPYLVALLDAVLKSGLLQTPILFSSTQNPRLSVLPVELQKSSYVMRIGPLKNKDLLYCLENWLRLAQPGESLPDREKLERAVPHLFGYPLAARLAAYYIMRHSVETLLEEVRYFKNLRIDIAKHLLGRTRAQLSGIEAGCLEALAVADTGASLSELASALQCDTEKIRQAIDLLATTLLVFPDNGRLQIHPIVKDYFWARVYETGKWKELAARLATAAKDRLSSSTAQSQEFVHYCSKAYRLLAMSGKLAEARTLAYDFAAELREVSRRLYHAKESGLALEYMDLWLEIEPRDRDIRWLKARCLTRLRRYKEAEAELSRLEKESYRKYRIDHAWGLLRRDQGLFEDAAVFFRKGLDGRTDYTPLLRDLGDMLGRLGDQSGAAKVLGRAYDLAPRDPYIVPKYVDILEKSGQLKEALMIMEGAISAFPEEAAFEHRMSTLLDKSGTRNDALTHARRAVELNPRLYEAVTHLAALELANGAIDNAEAVLTNLPQELPGKHGQIRDTVLANIHLQRGNLEAARACITRYDLAGEPYCAHILARVELADASRALGKGNAKLAKDRLRRAKDIIGMALVRFPEAQLLLEVAARITRLESEFEG